MGIEEKLTNIAKRIFEETGFIMPDMEYSASIDEWDELMSSRFIFHPCETKQLDTGQIQYRSDFGNFNIRNPRNLILRGSQYSSAQVNQAYKTIDILDESGLIKEFERRILKSSVEFALKNAERR